MGATTDKIKGAANAAAGKVKETAGKKTNDPKLAAKGAAQEVKGKVQSAKGKTKSAIEKA